MKKSLLLFLAMGASAMTFAAEEPMIYDAFRCDQMSANGAWMIGRSNTWEYEGGLYTESSICEVATGKIYGTADLYTLTPYSRPISNTGVAIMSTYDEETNYYEVPFLLVPGQEPKMLKQFYTSGVYAGKECYAMAIADDASCFLAYYEEYPKQYPFICAINDDYTVGEPEYLPLPAADINGEAPYYVTVTSMSRDCNTLAGMVMTGDGKTSYPIVYTRKNGDWEWYCPTVELYDTENPENFPNFYESQIALSADGTKLACTQKIPGAVVNFDDYAVWVFDLKEGTHSVIESENKDVVATQILDDGTVVGTFFATIKVSYIYQPGSEDFIDFAEYAGKVNPEYGKWMEDNLMVVVMDVDENGNQVETTYPNTGQVFVSDNLSVFGAGLQTTEYDQYYNPVLFSYVFTDTNPAGVENVNVAPDTENPQPVFNLQGVKVATVRNIEEMNALPAGIYIVNGKKVAIR